MALSRKLLLFTLCLAACLALVELYARHAVRMTPAGQALARYRPTGPDHAVFLGSSLTDAGVRTGLLDSLLGARRPGMRTYNLALAGLSGSDNYWLLYRGLLARSHPRYLVVEGAGIPFLPPKDPFRLEGAGLRVESFRSEYLDWEGFRHLTGGMPTPAAAATFWLHKNWFSYHHRLEIQARLRERFDRIFPSEAGTETKGNPYRMAGGAVEQFEATARSELARLESMSDGARAMRRPEARLLDLAAIARENGSTLVILRPPLPPSDSITARSAAFSAYHQGFRSLCDSLGIAYLDLSGGSGCGPYRYSDGIHLDEASSEAFTACLAAALADHPATGFERADSRNP